MLTHEEAKNFGQVSLIKQINAYYSKLGRPPISLDMQGKIEGYCHGITLLWLQKMAEGKEDWFYNTKKKIIEWADNELEKMEDDIDVQKFIAKIEFAQNPEIHTYDPNAWKSHIEKKNVDKLLETPKQTSKINRYTPASLGTLLEDIKLTNDNAIALTSRSKIKHTIGVFIRDNKYYLFDPNYRSGIAQCFDSAHQLCDEIEKRLYSNLKLDVPTRMYLDLKIVKASPDIAKNVSPPFFNSTSLIKLPSTKKRKTLESLESEKNKKNIP